jgi:hypothetical protein
VLGAGKLDEAEAVAMLSLAARGLRAALGADTVRARQARVELLDHWLG